MRRTIGPAGWALTGLLLCAVAASAQEDVIFLDDAGDSGRHVASATVYIEDSPAAEELIEQARHLQQQDRQTPAALKYQEVIEQYAGKLLAVNDGTYTDAARWVQRTLLADAKLLAAYRQAHEPAAARELARALRHGADEAALAPVFDRFAVCRSGLEAGLSLAAVCLEHARPGDAAVILDELAQHPDLATSAGRWHMLQAAAGLFDDQPERTERHLEALRQLGDTEGKARVDDWANHLRRPTVDPTIGPLWPAPVDAWPEVPDTPLWQVTTNPVDAADPGTATAVMNNLLGGPRNAAARLPLVPLVRGDDLYLNDGFSVMALDRVSGRPLWRYLGQDAGVPADENGSRPFLGSITDPRSVAIDGDAVVAVVGRARPFQLGGARRLYPTGLVSLAQRDGQARWRVQPGDLDETLARGFFHGTPIAHQGRIYVPVRRTQMSRFQGALLVAVDAASGRLLWRRYLSSAAPTSAEGARSLTQITFSAGRLYVVDYLGSVACLDGRTGSVLWLTTTAQAQESRPRINPMVMGRAAMLGGVADISVPPILAEAGLIVSHIGDKHATWLLDPAGGEKIRELTDPGWADADYVLPVSRPATGILTIGRAVRLYDGKTLELRWERLLPDADRPKGRARRPVVTRNHVAVPTSRQLHVLDLTTGDIVTERPLPPSRTVLALADQLIIAGVTSAFGHMNWEQASARLRQRIAAAKTDPTDGLALAHLALLTGNRPALLEGIDAALAAIQRRPPAEPELADDAGTDADRQQVFDFLRAMVDPRSGAPAGISVQARSRMPRVFADVDLQDRLFQRLAIATAGPGDVVAFRLALGRFRAAANKPIEAVNQYQAILTDQDLATQQVYLLTGSRQAGLEARMRLRSLVHEHGPLVYAEYEALAAERIAKLATDDTAPASAFVTLAEQFPLASVAPEARLAGAEILTRQGQLAQAVVQLNHAYAKARSNDLRSRIVGTLVEVLLQRSQNDRARRWLRRVRREHPDLQPLRAGTPVPIEQWLAELTEPRDDQNRLPAFALPPGKPYVLPERLLAPTAQPAQAWPRDMILTRTDRVLNLRAGPTLATRWQLPVDTADLTLLALTTEQALLWSEQHAVLTAVDVRTGGVVWESGDLRAAIRRTAGEALTAAQRQFKRALDAGGMGLRIRDGRAVPDRPVFRPGLMLAVGEMVVCIADRAGRVVALDRNAGHVLWQYRCAIEQLTHMAIDENTVAIAGTTELPNQSEVGAVFLLDALTGGLKLPSWQQNQPVGWLGFPDVGLFVYATASTVTALDLAGGDVRWRLPIEAHPMSGLGVAGNGLLLLRDQGGAVLMIDAVAPKLVRRLDIPANAAVVNGGQSLSALRLRLAGGQWHLLTPWRAQAWSPDGRLLWRDAISQDKQALLLQLVSENTVALAAAVAPTTPPPANNNAPPAHIVPAPRYRLFLLDRTGGAIRAECDLPTANVPLDPGAGIALDHRLVLTTATATIVIPDATSTAP